MWLSGMATDGVNTPPPSEIVKSGGKKVSGFSAKEVLTTMGKRVG
jgi:hypothetical protein